MKLGIFPNQWKTATVTAIFKKNNRQIKENYRPISLLSCISKVFEKIVFNQLYQYCTDNDILSDSNSGFRPNDSAINRLLHITDNIYKGLNEHNEILLVSLIDIINEFMTLTKDSAEDTLTLTYFTHFIYTTNTSETYTENT